MAKVSIIFLYLVAYALLVFVYYSYLVPIYGYVGLIWDPEIDRVIASVIVIAAILILLLPARVTKPSDVLLHLHFMFPIFPMLLLYSVAGWSAEFTYIVVLVFAMVCIFANLDLFSRLPVMPRINSLRLAWLLVAFSGFVLVLIVGLGGARYLNFDLSRVYEFRLAASENLPGVFGYLGALVAKVALPIVVVVGVIYRSYPLISLALIGCVLLFGLTALKSTLFFPLLAIGVFYLAKMARSGLTWLALGYVLLILSSTVGFVYGGNLEWIGNLGVRRMIIMPAQINFQYFDFFLGNSYVYWAESKISFGLVDSPYFHSIPNTIGWHYYGNINSHANTGWLGSGYANAGYFGMIVYSILIGIVLSLINSTAKTMSTEFVCAVASGPMLVLFTSTDLPSGFLNHGIIAVVIVLLLSNFDVSHEKKEDMDSRNRRAVAV